MIRCGLTRSPFETRLRRSSEAVTFFDCCRFGSLILLDGKRECESWRNYLMILQKAV
jgi:hypothetical protein